MLSTLLTEESKVIETPENQIQWKQRALRQGGERQAEMKINYLVYEFERSITPMASISLICGEEEMCGRGDKRQPLDLQTIQEEKQVNYLWKLFE